MPEDFDDRARRLVDDLSHLPLPFAASVRHRAAKRRRIRVISWSAALVAAGVTVAAVTLGSDHRSSVQVVTTTPTAASSTTSPTTTSVSTTAITTPPPTAPAATSVPPTAPPTTTAPTVSRVPLSPTATFASESGLGTWTGVEPTTIQFSADGGNIVGRIRWSTWTDQSASGTGTWGYNDCQPSCAEGHVTDYPATIDLSGPAHGRFTSLEEIQSGPHGYTFNYTLPSQVVEATTDVTGVCNSAGCPDVVVAAGSQITVEGTCPHAATTVQIVARPSQADDRVLYNGPIGTGNAFYIPVTVPDMGEPTTDVTADCQPGSALVVEATIEYPSA